RTTSAYRRLLLGRSRARLSRWISLPRPHSPISMARSEPGGRLMTADERLRSLLREWEERHGRGEDPSAVELCRDCPELTEPLLSEIVRLRSGPRTPAPAAAAAPPAGRAVPAGGFAGQRYRAAEYGARGGLGRGFRGE